MLWSHIAKARLHLRKGQGPAAMNSLKQAEDDLTGTGDVQLAAALYFTLAQALASMNETAKAVSCLIKAEGRGLSRLGEIQGQYYYASSTIVGRTNHALARHLKNRAQRLWAHQGIVSLEREMKEAPPARGDARATKLGPAVAINALGSAIDLAHTPRLLAQELVHVLAAVNVEASLTTEGKPQGLGDEISMPVGN